LSDFKKTSKIAAYFAPQQIIGEKVGLGLPFTQKLTLDI